MDKLEKARAQIDKIDSRMALLFEQRMALAAEIAQHKKQQGLPVLNTAREKEVLVKNTARLRDKSLQGYYIKFMEQVLGLSRRYQTQLMGRTVVACPSHEKAASQQVISQLFPGAQTTEAASMEDVFRAVEAGDAAWGVVPLATSGSDAPLTALELCARHQCYIGAMADLPTGRGKTTRFMVLSHQASEKGDRMALLVTLDNEVGYLAHIIEIIAEEGFAIEALKSRPVQKKAATNVYFIELALLPQPEKQAALLDRLQQASLALRVLGVYGAPKPLADTVMGETANIA
ncbi:MAG: hypothetical protein GXY32_04185 [Ruminococcaceae bacterium]|nr:hypothetical protein [Oscillospiraceae bacterium]